MLIRFSSETLEFHHPLHLWGLWKTIHEVNSALTILVGSEDSVAPCALRTESAISSLQPNVN